jgi:chromosome segregation ATPase
MAREEFETAAQAMKEWEDLANEERILRKNLEDRIGDLEEELSSQQEAYERAAGERDTQNQTVEGLQRALKDIQDARKKELRDLVESSQAQLDALRKQLDIATDDAASAKAALEQTQAELERLQPLQQEVKEKNLLIGKLRHEAVTLNEHLTKALRFLKKTKPGDTVDRQLVTNHLLQFLAMDRSDPKKFQVLQLIDSLLGWTEGTWSCALPCYLI